MSSSLTSSSSHCRAAAEAAVAASELLLDSLLLLLPVMCLVFRKTKSRSELSTVFAAAELVLDGATPVEVRLSMFRADSVVCHQFLPSDLPIRLHISCAASAGGSQQSSTTVGWQPTDAHTSAVACESVQAAARMP